MARQLLLDVRNRTADGNAFKAWEEDDGTISLWLNGVQIQVRSPENGFEDRTLSSIAFVEGTRTFTITSLSTNYYWSNQVRYLLPASDSIVIPDAEGLHYVYYDGDTLVSTQVFDEAIITDYAFIAAWYWDAVNNVVIGDIGEERHGCSIPSILHLYLHSTSGSKWGGGLQPVNVTHGTGALATDAQIGIEAGSTWDEDLQHVSVADPLPLTAEFLYRSGATGLWRSKPSTGYVTTTNGGAGRAAYNQWTGATWQLTELTNNDFCCMHLVRTNGSNKPFIWMVGQNRYATLALARIGADVEWQNLNLGPIAVLMPEFVGVATFIIQTATSYANAVKTKIVTLDSGESFVDLRRR